MKTIYFTPTVRARRAQMLTDLLPGFILLLAGLDGISNPRAVQYDMSWINIIAGGALMVAVIIEWRKKALHEHTRINRIDIFVGVVLFIEGLNRYKSGKGFQPADGYFLIGVVTIAKGFLYARLPRLRRMVLDEDRLTARTSPFTRLSLPWTEISAISFTDSSLEFRTQTGKIHRLSLRRIRNGDEIRGGIREYTGGRNIEISEEPDRKKFDLEPPIG